MTICARRSFGSPAISKVSLYSKPFAMHVKIECPYWGPSNSDALGLQLWNVQFGDFDYGFEKS